MYNGSTTSWLMSSKFSWPILYKKQYSSDKKLQISNDWVALETMEIHLNGH